MGKLETTIKSSKKSTICYIVTIVILLALSIGFLVAFIKERNENKQSDIPGSTDSTDSSSSTTPGQSTAPGGQSTTPGDQSTTPGEQSTTPAITDLRLPRSVLPIHYDLTVETNHQTDQFTGQVDIQLNVSESTNTIKIHSNLLDVNNIKVVDQSGTALVIKSTTYDTDREYNVIELNNELSVGIPYQLSLSFNGSLVGKIIGFYKSNYTDTQNQIRQFSATKFEPTYARQAFPCFDEPNIKATYNISIIHDKNLNAISNGIQIDQTVVDETRVKTVFSKTVSMSTYLVAYVISDFQYTKSSTVRGKEVRVFSRPDQLNNTRYALNTGIKILEYYEQFFGIDYPLEKLDLVALPVFVSGAMENWGLITFRETNLLYSDDGSSTSEMKRVAAVIAHELAHMWFGNLVTMDWWDDLWLNEGFASYIEYRGENSSEPDWHIDQFFLNDDLQGVMRLDALDSSHPIIQPVNDPDQITEIFDTISYSKGSSVLRMLEYAIGSDVFRKGVIDYIEKHLYSNAKTEDLWNSIQTILDKNPEVSLVKSVTNFMGPWTLKKGFPVVTVTRVSTNQIKVSQQKFSLNSEEQNSTKDDSYLWPIFLTIISENSSQKFYLDKSEDTFQLDTEIPLDSWIKFNIEESGFYIVNYGQKDWQLLIDLLKNNKDDLSPTDRSNIIFDASMLTESGLMSYDSLFDLLSYVKDEDNLIPWMAVQSCLNRINDKLETSDGGLAMKQFTKDLTRDIYSSLGWQFEGRAVDSFQQKLLRSRAISMACGSDNEECLNSAKELFKQFIDSETQIDPNIREYVYSYGVQESSTNDWNTILELWKTEISSSEKSKLLNALTSKQDSQLLSKLISLSNDPSVVNDQDFFTVQQSIASNTIIGRQLVWNYLRDKWEYLTDRFTKNDRRLGTFVSTVCSSFNTDNQLKEMEAFFAKYPDSGAGQNARNQAIERVTNNIKWLNTNSQTVVQWLDSQSQSLNPWLNWRLDSLIIPQSYDIYWNVNLSTDTFSGNVTIEVNVKKPINYFIVHQKGLLITESKAYSGNMKSFKTNQLINSKNSSFAYQPNDFWVIPTDTTLRPSNYVLYFEFNGNLSTGLDGLYKSIYVDSNNVSQSLATTQFQSTYARKAVPCFDEPQFKSTFKITVTHSAQYQALSNMPGLDTSVVGDTAVTKFDTSVQMVTYLVALVVSEFECIKSSIDARVQVCGAPGNEVKLQYSLVKTPEILSFYEKDYFEIDYPLPKLDNIAIPDFSAGAMENWGLVTYREVYLFYDENESSTRDQMRVCMIICHELAHMWFGNLVTTKWWDDLWLNEGFATFMSYKAVAKVEPEWRYDEVFALDELARVFDADSTPNTHAILASVQNADDISSVFDAITYGKGASILRMLETTLGVETFRIGIKNYLNKYAYQNTLTADLWSELSSAHPERLNVSEIMDSWVKRKGFPVVTITRNITSNKVTLKQELFLKDSSNSQTNYFWKIPVTYRAPNDKTVYTEWLEESEKSVFLKSNSDLIKFNVDQTGLFIVNYPTADWKEWSQELNDENSKVREQLSPLDRSELINDAFYLARSGRLDYELALNLSKYLRYEDSLIPWTTTQTMFSYIKNLIYSDADIALNYYMNDIISKKYQSLGWDDTVGDAQTRRLRTVIVDMACGYQMEDCLTNATKLFSDWKSGERIAPNLLSLVLRYGIRHSNHSDDFYYLLNKYQNTNSAQEKLLYLQGLTSTQTEFLINQLLANASNEEFVRKHDFFTFLTNIALNSRTGATLVWNYFRDNYEEIEKRFTINNSNLGRIVYTLSTGFTTVAQKQEVLDLFKKYPKSGAGKLDRDKALEVLDTNIRWLNNYKNKVIEWVTNQCPKSVCLWNIYRLNEQIVPIQYYLTVQVNTTNNIFNGTVQIEVNAQTDVEYFIVHSADILDVNNSRVFDNQTNEELVVKQTFRYSPLQFWVIRLEEKSGPKVYRLSFDFSSNLLLGGLSGLYKSTYQINNETRGLAATQFQATSARKAFPCFDEPSFRSKFDITIIHDNFNNVTISNMPASMELPNNPVPGWTTSKFQNSVSMVSYLVAMMVSDFACRVDPVNDHPYVIRVCASPVKEYKLQYALDMTPKIFTAFETYLNYSYQLPKSDLVAIPDFSAGAMENWGLVKFRETALLWTADEDTSASKISVNTIIAHELAHMWFGNLLTCNFWGDLWLNEGFASFMEYPATNYSEPDWDYWDTFVFYDLSSAVSSDSSINSAPIVRQVLTPSDMSYSSAIVYNKGATVIRMMEFAMGAENFKDGIREYLKDHEYQTVVTKNLWDSLNNTFPPDLNTNIYELMDSWTMKAGFPYINVTRNPDNTLTIIQERFLSNGQKPVEDTLWTIPLSYYTSFDNSQDYHIIPIKQKQQTITLISLDNKELNDQLYKLNVDYRGMYFVNYPLEDWDKWISALVNNTDNILSKLTPSDRAEFVLDAFYLAKANKLPLLKAYQLSKYIVNEDHFTPWSMFNSMFDNRYRLLMTQYKDSLQNYLSYLTAKQYQRLGWNDTEGNDITKRLRALIVDISCNNGYQQCLEDAYTEFTKWKSGQPLPPNLRDSILRYGIQQTNDSQDFEYVWEQYLNPNTTLKSNYLTALTYSLDENLLKSLLERSLDDRVVSLNNFVSITSGMVTNSKALPILWQFFKDNYEMLTRKLSSSQLSNVFNSICQYFGDITKRVDVENFLKLYPNTGLSNSSRQNSVNLIKANIDWIFANSDTIGQWLAENGCGLEPCPWSVYRLNSNIKPIKYYPIIQVNVTTNIYNGSVAIEVNATESVQYFIVHASSILNVTDARVRDNSTGNILPAVKTFRYKPYDFFVIQLVQSVEPGVYRLEYDFNGNLLLGGLSGLYRSNYIKDNKTIGLASTQFEFTDARKAFPCFDEPSFKSVFELTLIHDQHMNATLSNMPVNGEPTVDPILKWVNTTYAESVQMVSYLVAMVVSDYVCKNSTIDGKDVGVCASSVQSHKMDYSLETTKNCLHHLAKDYLQIDYPLPKVDMVAIPDFAYGAMENWGLVTFRETGLLWTQTTETSSNKMSVAAVIAHELAHFWFGNYVTCQWWSNFWLNEGFATYMEYTAVNYTQPDWGYFDLFMISDYVSAVTADSSATSHPLVRTVESPLDVQQYSSAIIYSKGATVIRMLESVMTPEGFQSGIQNYLRKNSYGNTVTKDLLDALNDNFPQGLQLTIYDLMDPWTTKAGFPYINVTKNSDNTYTITQERFLANGKQPENDTIWPIPLSYYQSFDTQKINTEFIRSKNQTITLDTDPSVNGLIKFNADNKGMFFVNYPLEDWDKWTEALVNNDADIVSKLTPSDRGGFILDAFFLSRADFLPYVKPLQLAKYLVKETHLTPWTIAISSFQTIQKYMLTTEYRNDLMNYFIQLSQPLYNQLGWADNGTDTEKRLRTGIIDFVCGQYYKPCLESALQEYSKWKAGEQIPPNLLTSTLRYAIRQSADRTDWDFLWNKYINESSASVKLTYLNAMSYTTDPILANLLLNRLLDPKLVRTQDIPTVLNYFGSNYDVLQILWEFYKENYQKLIGKLTTIQLGTVLNNICSQFTNTTRKQEVESFLSSNQNLGVTNFDKNRAIETINANIDWMRKHKEEIGNFLRCGSDSCPWTSYRLNENIIPVNYNLYFNVDVIGNRFEGNTSIEVNATEEVEYFIVNAAETLNITGTRVFLNGSDQEFTINNTFRYIPFEFWVIQMSEKLPPNTYELVFLFESELNQNMVGLYKSQYYKDGQPIGLAATQFQATHARKAFPCFDEPTFKSIFEVSITSTANMTLTIANTRQHQSVTDGIVQTLYFEKTVPMSTYLIALVVSDFVCNQTSLNDGLPVRVCSSDVESYKLNYSLDVSPKLLDYFGNYLGYNYSEQGMNKADFIAIPDFSAGAMENWGLITFRETAMLWIDTESTTTNKMSVISVIAHEIAHMWFGNLLTCKWWSDLWLNEAFASYMEYTSVNDVEPEWNINDLFLMTDYVTAVSADSSTTSHAIVRPINSPEERAYTSAIIYQKGASVLRMLEFVMTNTQFQSALKQYIRKYQFQTVMTQNLWDELDKFFPQDTNTTIYELMDSWTTKAGFPYLNITRDNSVPNRLTVKQQRFLSNGQTLDSDTIWTVPLSYYTSLDTNSIKTEYIKQKEQTIDITIDESNGGLLKLNTDNKGFYFVNYPEEDWIKWIDALTNQSVIDKLTPSDRTNFIIDSFYLSRAGLLSYLKPLELSKYLVKETHLQPWSVAISMFEPIRRYLSSTEHKQDLDLYLSGLAQQTYETLGWDDSQGTDVERRLRSTIVEFICSTDYEPCLQSSQQMYYEWRVNSKLPPNILAPALRYAIRRINLTSDWNNLWQIYSEETSTVLKLTYLNALSFTSNTDLIKQLLDYSLNETLVRKQDYLSVLNYVITNPDGLQVMWDYYRNNYTLLSKQLSESQLGTIVNNICNYFSDDNRRKEVKEFFDLNPTGVTLNERNRALETIDSNINWINTNKILVGNWLKTQTFISKGTENIKIWSKHKNRTKGV